MSTKTEVLTWKSENCNSVLGFYVKSLECKCTYAWLARLRTWADCNKLWIMTKHNQNVNHMANTRTLVLREIISPLSLRNPWRVVSTIYQKGQDTWRYQAKWLHDHGWIVQSPWDLETWGNFSYSVHWVKLLVINLGAVSNSFARIDLHTPRHEVGGVHHATWKELLAVDWKGVRKKANVDPAYRAVACGATVSPAWFQNRNTFSTSCIWCKAPATWYHIAWESPSLSLGSTPEPHTGVAWRFGWVTSNWLWCLWCRWSP